MDDEQSLGKTLHQLLLDEDVTAPSRIAEAFFEQVCIKLQKKHAPQYHDLVVSAVEEAFINYFDRPEKYDPDQKTLVNYLVMSANGDFLNLLEREKRYVENIDESVELDADNSEYSLEALDSNVEKRILIKESTAWEKIKELLPEPLDQKLVALLIDGIRETNAYANILGITDKPIEEQKKIVKRHKDRLKKQLQRNIDPSELRNV